MFKYLKGFFTAKNILIAVAITQFLLMWSSLYMLGQENTNQMYYLGALIFNAFFMNLTIRTIKDI